MMGNNIKYCISHITKYNDDNGGREASSDVGIKHNDNNDERRLVVTLGLNTAY